MAAGGHEALLFIQVIALGLASIPFVRRSLLQAHQGKLVNTNAYTPSQIGHTSTRTVTVLHALSLTGLIVWRFNDPLTRLLGTAASSAGFAVLLALQWGRAWELNRMDRAACSEWHSSLGTLPCKSDSILPQPCSWDCSCPALPNMPITGESPAPQVVPQDRLADLLFAATTLHGHS